MSTQAIEKFFSIFKAYDYPSLIRKHYFCSAISALYLFGKMLYEKYTLNKKRISQLNTPIKLKNCNPKLRKTVEKIKLFAKKMHITQELIVSYDKDKNEYTAFSGVPYLISPVICISEKEIVSEDALNFVICHELSHIKNDHSLKLTSLTFVIGTIMGIVMDILFPQLSLFYSFVITLASFIPFILVLTRIERYYEKVADIEAIKVLKTSKGAVEHFKNQIKLNLDKKSKGEENITEEGNDELDCSHPPLSERIQYLTKV